MADEGQRLNAQYVWMGPYGYKRYSFDMYRVEGLDNLRFINPDEPLPREAESGTLDLDLGRQEMTDLLDLLTHLLDNWGKDKGNRPKS